MDNSSLSGTHFFSSDQAPSFLSLPRGTLALQVQREKRVQLENQDHKEHLESLVNLGCPVHSSARGQLDQLGQLVYPDWLVPPVPPDLRDLLDAQELP